MCRQSIWRQIEWFEVRSGPDLIETVGEALPHILIQGSSELMIYSLTPKLLLASNKNT